MIWIPVRTQKLSDHCFNTALCLAKLVYAVLLVCEEIAFLSMIGCFFRSLLTRIQRYGHDVPPWTSEPSVESGGAESHALPTSMYPAATSLMTSMTCNNYGSGSHSGPKTRAEACRQQCQNRLHARNAPAASQHYDADSCGTSDDWRYQPCPPCCVPPAPCPPTCSDFHLTTTEYYPANNSNASCRWDNATCYNEGNDQSGNFIKQWNRHCHFTTYRDGAQQQSGGGRRGSSGGGGYGHNVGVFGTTYPSSCCSNKDTESARTYPRSDIRSESAGGRSLISGAPQCHRKVEKVYSKPMKSDHPQASVTSGGGGPAGTSMYPAQNNVTAMPTRSPKAAITASLVDPAMLNRHGNQLWGGRTGSSSRNSQRILAHTSNTINTDKVVDAQHRNVEMPILFFRKPKDNRISSV